MTTLMIAARYNRNPEVIRVLLESGADVNAIDLRWNKAIVFAERNRALRGTDSFALLLQGTSKIGNTQLSHIKNSVRTFLYSPIFRHYKLQTSSTPMF